MLWFLNHTIVKSAQYISFIFTPIHYQSSGDVNEIDVTHRSKETNSSYKRNFYVSIYKFLETFEQYWIVVVCIKVSAIVKFHHFVQT